MIVTSLKQELMKDYTDIIDDIIKKGTIDKE